MEAQLRELSLFLEKQIALSYPDDFLEKYVHSARDLYVERSWVRKLPATDSVLFRIISIVHDASINRRRIRTVPCLKLIKGLVKQRWEIEPVPSEILSLLFDLFKQYVNHKNEEVQWAVTVFLKNQILDDTQVLWLIQNWSESIHITNRLLLYPCYDSQIGKWAERMLKEGNLLDRRSDLISRVLIDAVPSYLEDELPSVLLWGIYRSSMTHDLKVRLMENHLDLDHDTVITVVAISERLKNPTLLCLLVMKIEFMLDNL